MNLPAIDIPVQLPFEVPLLVHPIFVHFAIAIPVIVFLLEIANIKARNRAVSVTSLFLMTLALLVYAGAFFSGKADGSHAYDALSAAAQEELGFHKLLGTYLVYAMGILFVLKLLAMLVKKPWARDFFLAMLLIFIGVTFKQAKDGGELVYKYGVNVAAAQAGTEAHEATAPAAGEQEAVEESGEEAAPAAEAPAEEKSEPAATEPAGHEEAAPAEESGAHEATPATESVEEATHEAVQEAAEAVEEKAEEATEAAQEAAHEAEEAAQEATEAAHEATEAATEAVEHTAPTDSSEHEAPAGH
ncbi:DUF2231 domain-containing protein [Hydrogenimonas sp.]|uniref:DUF2231 domain-containing protein n=1 Tax=Hydrogenimonas sp. TaxID=2231112 RepID=UPI0026035449|nr:DUF2231 domain-containing protein [Hydrogenimonas sp.]